MKSEIIPKAVAYKSTPQKGQMLHSKAFTFNQLLGKLQARLEGKPPGQGLDRASSLWALPRLHFHADSPTHLCATST